MRDGLLNYRGRVGGQVIRCTQPRCRRFFRDRSIDLGVGSIGNFTNVSVETVCPYCGTRVAHVIQGSFLGENGGWRRLGEALRPEGVTAEDYRRLAEALRDLQNEDATPEQTAAAVARVPVFAGLAEWVRAHPEASRWVVGILVTILFGVLSQTKSAPAPPPQPPPTVVVNEYGPDRQEIEREIARQVREAIEEQEHADRQHDNGPEG